MATERKARLVIIDAEEKLTGVLDLADVVESAPGRQSLQTVRAIMWREALGPRGGAARGEPLLKDDPAAQNLPPPSDEAKVRPTVFVGAHRGTDTTEFPGRSVRRREDDEAGVLLGAGGGGPRPGHRGGLLFDARERVENAALLVGLGGDVAAERHQLPIESGRQLGRGGQLFPRPRPGAGEDPAQQPAPVVPGAAAGPPRGGP